MQGIIKQLPILGLAAALAALAPRTAAAQETTTRDSIVQAAPGDTGEVQNPSGYQGLERTGDSALTDTSAYGDSLSRDTSPSDSFRIDPTDSVGTGTAIPGDTGSVLPGDTESLKPKSPTDRVAPSDSPTQGP